MKKYFKLYVQVVWWNLQDKLNNLREYSEDFVIGFIGLAASILGFLCSPIAVIYSIVKYRKEFDMNKSAAKSWFSKYV